MMRNIDRTVEMEAVAIQTDFGLGILLTIKEYHIYPDIASMSIDNICNIVCISDLIDSIDIITSDINILLM